MVSPGVLLVGNHAPPYGGVPNHIGNLAAYLSNNGWRVHVLADVSTRRGDFEVNGYQVHAPTRTQKLIALPQSPPHTVRRRVLRGPNRRWPYMFGDLARASIIRRLVVENELSVISAYHVLRPGLSAALVAEEVGIPLITTIFGEFYARPDEHLRRLSDVRYVLERSSVRLSCSHHCALSVEWLGLNSLPTNVLYYGADLELFHPTESPRGDKFVYAAEPEASRVVVAFVGRMQDEMGLQTLIDALPKLLSNSLVDVVISGGRGELYGSAVQAAERFAGRVTVHTDVSQSDLVRIYQNADIVVAPSTNARACLGLAIIEAMACELPVVASDVGGTSEVVLDGHTGTLIPGNDADALATATLRYVENAPLRNEHGANGRTRAESLFDIRETNRIFEQILRSLL